MRVVVSEFAKQEIDDATQFYDAQKQGLGKEFKTQLKTYIQKIAQFPILYPIAVDEIRRVVLHRFPYSIYYSVDDKVVVILSVAHQHRKPYYWIASKVHR